MGLKIHDFFGAAICLSICYGTMQEMHIAQSNKSRTVNGVRIESTTSNEDGLCIRTTKFFDTTRNAPYAFRTTEDIGCDGCYDNVKIWDQYSGKVRKAFFRDCSDPKSAYEEVKPSTIENLVHFQITR